MNPNNKFLFSETNFDRFTKIRENATALDKDRVDFLIENTRTKAQHYTNRFIACFLHNLYTFEIRIHVYICYIIPESHYNLGFGLFRIAACLEIPGVVLAG